MIQCFIGTTELLLIGGLALLLFGGKKLPEMMRGLGKGVKEFKSGLRDDDESSNQNADIDNQESLNPTEEDDKNNSKVDGEV